MDDLIGAGGEVITAGSLLAEMAEHAQAQADETRREWQSIAERLDQATHDQLLRMAKGVL